jgi:hypothetical protein
MKFLNFWEEWECYGLRFITAFIIVMFILIIIIGISGKITNP